MMYLLSILVAGLANQPATVSAPAASAALPASILVDVTAPPVGALPPLAGEVAPAIRARADLLSLFTTKDYPREALMNGEGGEVTYVVSVDRAGRISTCTVTKSSGSASLDVATCSIIQSRAQFAPARDGQGRAVADRFSGRIRWDMPTNPPTPFADHKVSVIFTTDEKSEVIKCRVEQSDQILDEIPFCDVMMPDAQRVSAAAGKRNPWPNHEVIFEQGLMIGGPESAQYISQTSGPSTQVTLALALEIDAAGAVTRCVTADETVDPERVAVGCKGAAEEKFVALDATAADRSVRHGVRYWLGFTRPIK